MDPRCAAPSCSLRPHTRGLCWRHTEEKRRLAGDLCSVDGCARGRFYRGMCGSHASADSRAQHGRNQAIYPVVCAWCGTPAIVTKRTARYCSSTCAKQRQATERQARRRAALLPVLHPNPDRLSWLPERHPARRPAPRRSEWWKMLVSGPCAWCREPFTAAAVPGAPLPAYCSHRCLSAKAKAKAGLFVVSPADRRAIYERDGWVCQLCDGPVDPDLGPSHLWAATLDHIECRAWVLVPDHSPANLRLAHRWCNSVRGDERHHSANILRAS